MKTIIRSFVTVVVLSAALTFTTPVQAQTIWGNHAWRAFFLLMPF